MAIGRAIKVNEKDIKAYRLVNRNKAARANAMGVTAIMGVSNGRGARSKFLRRTTVTKIKPPKSGRRVVGGIELYSSPPKKHREAGAVKRAHYALPQGYRYPIHGRSQKISEKYVKRAMSYYGKSRDAYSPVVRREIEFGIARGARALGLTSPKAAVYRKKFKLNPRARGEDMLFLKRNPKRKAPKASIGGKHVTLRVVKGAVRATVPNKKKAAKPAKKRKASWKGPIVRTVIKGSKTTKRRGFSIKRAKKVGVSRYGTTMDLLVTNRRRKGYRRNPESYFEMMESGELEMPSTISERERAKFAKEMVKHRSDKRKAAFTKRIKAGRKQRKLGRSISRKPWGRSYSPEADTQAKAILKAEKAEAAKARRMSALVKAREAKKAKYEKELAEDLKQLRKMRAQAAKAKAKAAKQVSKAKETKEMKKRAKKTVSKSKKASKSGTQKKARKTRKTLSKKAFLARMAAGRKRAAAKRAGKVTKNRAKKTGRKPGKRKASRKPAKKGRKVAKKGRKPARKATRRVKRNARRRMFRRNPMLATVQSYIKPGLFALGGFVAHSVLTSLVADFASSRLGLKAGSRSLSAAATALAGGWVAAKYAKANAQEIIVGMAVSLARTVIAEFAPTVAPKLGLSGTRMVGTAADFAPRYSVGEYYQATGALPMEAAAGTGEYFSSNMFPVSGAGEYFLPSMSVQGYGDYEVQPGFSSSTAGIGVAEGVLPTDDMDATFNMMEAAAGIGAYAGGPSPAPVSTYIPHERALTVGNKAEDTTAGIFDIGGSNGVLS